MATFKIDSIYPYFIDTNGNPIDNGLLFIGEESENPETHPITIYADNTLTIPLENPLKINNGYPYSNGTPTNIFVSSNFSITLKNSRSEIVFTTPVGINIISILDYASKTIPVDADLLMLYDSADEFNPKSLSWANLYSKLFNNLITGTAITQTDTDETAGRLTKVGDYGFPYAIIQGTVNVNTLSKGRNYVNSTSTNIPVAVAGFVDCTPLTGSNIMQVFTTVSAAESATAIQYVRTGNHVTQVYTSWIRIYSQRNILGTVSQSAGIPTGAIIEVGSNASGEWTKFADGTVIGSSAFSADTNITTASGSVFIATVNITMPVSMTSVDSVQLVAQRVSGGVVWSGLQSGGFSTAQANTYIIASTTGTVGKVKINFKGKWF